MAKKRAQESARSKKAQRNMTQRGGGSLERSG